MKKYFIKIQNKILLLFICVFFIPFGIFSIYVYNNFSKNLENSVLQNITREIEQNDKLLFFNIWFTEYISQKLCNDRYIQVAFSDYNENNDALAQYIAGILNDVSMVQGIVVFPASKATFHYGYDPGDKGYVDFMVNYGKIKTTDGNLQWVSSVENGIIVAGTILRDTMITRDKHEIAAVYFIVSEELFSNIMRDNQGNTMICDENGNIIISNNKALSSYLSLWNYSSEINDFVYQSREQHTYINVAHEDKAVIKYKSQFIGWYFIQEIPKSRLFKDVTFLRLAALSTGGIIFVLILVIYLLFIRKLFRPIRNIAAAMRSVVVNNFDVTLEIRTNDEFSQVGDGFNYMVRELRNLIAEMEQSNQEKIRAEIEALQYQINPHFLYNILAAARFIALQRKDEEVAEILLKLNRLFRAQLRSMDNMVTIREDIQYLEDYVFLLNLRYENQIEFQFDIRDSALDCRIPSMIMQPLIENAVVHGVGEYIKTGRRKPFIRICADHTDNILKINIYDNGKGIPEEQRMSMENGIFKEDGHIGFQNVAKRLRLYYGDRLEIHIRSELDKFTDIRICINLDN